jgi:predicted PurR-regulated permease PerM
MQVSRHIHLTGTALKQWFIGQCYDSACVGLLWFAGLTFLQVPFATFWALLATLFQFIPQFGMVLNVIGPLIAAAFVNWETALYVLILYGAIVVIDGLLLQPLIMRRQTRVPIWASLIVPIFLSLFLGFWGFVIAAPLLAVIFTYRALAKGRTNASPPQQTPPGQVITGGRLVDPGEPTGHIPRPE